MDRVKTMPKFVPAAVAAFALLLAGSGCSPEPYDTVLSYACGRDFSDPCELSGDVEQTTGLTADSIGFVFGPAGGVLRIPIRSLIGSQGSGVGEQDLDLLAVATTDTVGTLTSSIDWGDCPTCPVGNEAVNFKLTSNYEWLRSVEGLVWTGSFSDDPGFLVIQATNAAVVEIRVTEYESNF